MKDQIDIIRQEIKALERELFPEYFGYQEEEDNPPEEEEDVA